MYGEYFNSNRRIPEEEYENIEPGTPIVLSNPSWGAFRQFAIFVNTETIVYQKYIKLEDGRDAYQIQVMSLENFTNYGENVLFEYKPSFEYATDTVVDNALSFVDDNIYLGLRSVVGDDFVLECLVGTEEFPYVLHSMNIGYHCQRNDENWLNTSIMPLPLKEGGLFILRQQTKVTNQSSPCKKRQIT